MRVRVGRVSRWLGGTALLLLVLAGLGAWGSRPPASPDVPLSPVVRVDTFAPPHRARLHLQRQDPPRDALLLNLRLRNTGPAPTGFMVGVCDFQYAVVRVADREVVRQTAPEPGCLLAGLNHEVQPGQTQTVAGTVIPATPPLPTGQYVAFASLSTDGGVIVAEPLPFRITWRGQLSVD